MILKGVSSCRESCYLLEKGNVRLRAAPQLRIIVHVASTTASSWRFRYVWMYIHTYSKYITYRKIVEREKNI